ncbi:MAG: efflux RND transporter permease subunit [Elusimicrobia bacterium]|nr:efflux RND transporter permease subunit [Elusimicrobiota bacterium]
MVEKVLARPITFFMLFIAITIIGVIALLRIPIELMPNTSYGEISIIYSIRGGIPPDKVEHFVIKPVEEAVGGVSNLKDILSIAKEGRATIVLMFGAATNMDISVMEVREKLALIKDQLPQEVERPIVAQYEQEDIPILIFGITSPVRTPEDIRKIIDASIKDKIARVEGVANVDVFGGRERKIIVEVMPEKLKAYSMPMSSIINSLNMANVSLLAGDVAEADNLYTIKTSGRFENISEIENLGIQVSDEGSIIRLRDVAKIKDSFLEPENLSRLNENQNVTIYVQKETLASTVEVNKNVIEKVNELRKVLPQDLIITLVKDDAVYINKSLNSMKESLVIGGLLATAILMLFFKNIRLTVIVFFTIPLSVFITLTLLYFNKMKLNVMTIGGLALGVGMLLDNTIVVIENIFRIRETTENISKFDAIIIGATQIILPIVASTLTTIIVFLPFIFLSGDIKQMQGGMAITITYSLVASLFVALTLIPLLFSRLNIKALPKNEEEKIPVYYEKLLRFTLRFRVPSMLLALVLFALSVVIFTKIDMNLFEAEEETKFTVHVELPTGAKLDVSDEKVKIVEAILKRMPEVQTVSSKIEKWSSKIFVDLVPQKDREKTKAEIMEELRPKFKEIQPAFIYFKESQELAAKEVFIEIYGHSYEKIKEMAMTIGGQMKAIEDITDVKIRMREGRPEKLVYFNRDKLATYGLNVKEVANVLHARLRGLVATRYHEEGKEIETIVRQDIDTVKDFTDLYGMALFTPHKEFIQLAQVAEFTDDKGPSEIWRKNKRRMVQVSGTRNRLSLEKAVKQIVENLREVKVDEDYFWEVGGEYEIMMRNKSELMMALALTIILVYLVLASLFESYIQPVIIMISVPLAMIGVVISLKATKSTVTTGVIMGIIMLAGIVVNNSIILIDRINGMRESGEEVFKCVVDGCKQRLRPIFMTVSTTILGLLPLAIKGGEGSALWKPLAITVIGGLMSSTILVLFIVPCAYLIFEYFSFKRR